MDYLAAILLMFTGIFLILLVLIQRGRGGGLAGAFGGMGGQSAFGTKAGDVFTRITIGAAVVWVVLAGLSILTFQANQAGYFEGGEQAGARIEAGAGGGGDNEDEGDQEKDGGTSDESEDKDSAGDKETGSTETPSTDSSDTSESSKTTPPESSDSTPENESPEKPE